MGAHRQRWHAVVDPLVVVVSEDLDQAEHPSERVTWVWPDEVEEVLAAWSVEWTDVRDDLTGQRFGP